MRRFAVAAVLLACLMGTALATGPTNGQPRKHTGATSCVQPIGKLQCVVDKTSGYVMGLRYGYNDADAYFGFCAGSTCNGDVPADPLAIPPVPGSSCNGGTAVTTGQPSPNVLWDILPAPAVGAPPAAFITRVEVTKLPGAKNRGKVPIVRFYFVDAAGVPVVNGAAVQPGAPAYVTCGDPALDGRVVVTKTFTPPAANMFLGSFTTKCTARNIIHDANDALFSLKSIEKPCWAPQLPAAGH